MLALEGAKECLVSVLWRFGGGFYVVHYVAQAGLQLRVLLPWPPGYWGCGYLLTMQ